MKSPTTARRGFSITEILVVISVIVVLLGLLLPALAGIRKSGLMTKSMANMRQIGTWMTLYSGDNRDFIVPSQFNYWPEYPVDDALATSYRGRVRSEIHPNIPHRYMGTWADILWTVNEIGVFPEAEDGPLGHDYRYDSPDGPFYGQNLKDKSFEIDFGEGFDNPLRSAAKNSRHSNPNSTKDLATPFGCGASEMGLPGYFAANNFFNADSEAKHPCTGTPLDNATWYSNSQIRMPEQSMYLVDSFAGETIEPEPRPYLVNPSGPIQGAGGNEPTHEVDFRYSDMCLMMFLDGHVEPQGRWDTICDLDPPFDSDASERVKGRGIRIRNLTKRALRLEELPPGNDCP